MIGPEIVTLLKETLTSIREAAELAVREAPDERIGWNNIITLYEVSIGKAESNKYFSVKDACRIYLEFCSNYTSAIYNLMEKTDLETGRYFRNILASYMEGRVSSKMTEDNIKELARHADIYEELINYLLAGEKFNETTPLAVEGYTAEQLTNSTILNPLGAFNYLVYLREEPEEALADLKANLPHRKIFDQDDLEEVHKTMDEKTISPVEDAEQATEAPRDDGILAGLNAVQEALAALRQTFDDKIAEDAHKNALFDNMHRELVRYQNGALDKIVDTIALDIIQLVDSTKGHVRVYEKKEPTEENYKRLLRVVKGIAEDLEDILYRQNIESYRVPGHEVDVRRQKIIQTVPTDDRSKDNLVAVRVADGYEKDDKVLRPERIKIFKYEPNPEEPSES